ncbi:MAG: hypothetical protein FD168_1381 [Desulfobulbaceae bacterium]|nr:MAG: hypothetical protein FD168_1381 [Desulfobulbaceae bacterium]
MEYTLDALNIEQITNLYLYGTLEKPADLTSDSLIRPPDVADDQDAMTIVHLDAVSFMTSGPGRFANGQQSPLVKAFMEGS